MPKLLIADDDKALRESLMSAFKPMGFKVYLASGGSMAVTVARKEIIDLAILDVNMPDLNGIEAFRRIRRVRSGIECVFITSEAARTVRDRVGSEDSYRLVRKPFRIDSLRGTVLDLLKFRESREDKAGTGDRNSRRPESEAGEDRSSMGKFFSRR